MKTTLCLICLLALASFSSAQGLDFTALYTSDGAKYGVARDLAPLTTDGKWTISAVAAIDPNTMAQLWAGAGVSYKATAKTGVQGAIHAGLTSDIFKPAALQKVLWYAGASVRF